jgi:hypothetical protein
MALRNPRPDNNEMQRTKHGKDGASPLISVFAGPRSMSQSRLAVVLVASCAARREALVQSAGWRVQKRLETPLPFHLRLV